MTESDRQRAREIADELLTAPPGRVGDVLRRLDDDSQTPPAPPGGSGRGRNRAVIAGAGLAAVLVAATFAYALTRPSAPVAVEAPSDPAATPSPSAPTLDASPSEVDASQAPDPVDAGELIRTFYEDFTAAVRSGTAGELHPSLHPLVVEAYGDDRCRTYLDGFAIEDFDAKVIDVADAPEPWTWEATDASYDVPAAYAVDLEVTQSGATSAIVGHVVVEDGRVLWFTRCDGAT